MSAYAVSPPERKTFNCQLKKNTFLMLFPDIFPLRYCLSKCKCKCEATVQLRAANISSFESGLVSSWPSFFLDYQSLHLCLGSSSPLSAPARTSLSFILILFHASSFSYSLLIHHHPHSALRTHTPLIQYAPWPDTNTAFIGPHRWQTHCDSSLHWTPFGIHHVLTPLSRPDWST